LPWLTLPLSGRHEAIAIEVDLMAACPLQGLVRRATSKQTSLAGLQCGSSILLDRLLSVANTIAITADYDFLAIDDLLPAGFCMCRSH
jgi:hypothetical protein